MEDQKQEEKQEDNKSMIDKAAELAERIERANEVTAELLTRQEALRAHQILGGRAEAGTPPPKVDDNAGAREMLKGTGYDEMLFPMEKK